MLAARRDGAERARRHADRAGAVVAAVADLALPGDHEEQIPDPRVHVCRELFAGVHAEQAGLGCGDLMQHRLGAGSVHVAARHGEHIGYADDLGSLHVPLFAAPKL